MTKNRVPLIRVALLYFFLFCFFLLCSGPSIARPSSLFEHFSSADGLPSEKIYDAAQTPDGNIWFATARGICRFDGIAFRCYGADEGLADAEITGLLTDFNGKLWCWSSAGRIFYFENNLFLPLKNNAELSVKIENRIINSLCIGREGHLWVSTVIPGELLKIIPGRSIEELKYPEKPSFSFFIRQVEEKSYVFGSLKAKEENNRLAVFLEDETFTIALSEKGNFSKSSFYPVPEGGYLFAKGQEIVYFRPDRIIQRSFTEKNVQDILRDTEGKIWVGLYLGGVVCYPEGTLSSAGMIHYLGNKSVSSILEDNSGNIWFTTMGDGIFYLPARSDLRYASPKIYSQKNSLKSEEKPKAVMAAAGQQSIAQQPDFRVISTDTSLHDTLPPSIYISGVKIMEKDTLVQTHYDLTFDKNFIRINFVGFAFSNPEALKYKYKMAGIDEAWIYTDNTFAQYTTLPAGNYSFSVSAMNKNGTWSDSPAVISFTILPPYWKTWWFITLQAAIAAAVILALFFIRVSQIKKREKEKAELNRQMANAELQALRAQMNPHFIFNTLSSIQHFITTNETEEALKYLSRFARLMRKIMDNSKKPAIPLKDELEALRLYLELESLRFKNKFDYSVILDEKIDVNDDAVPPMLIQPYIENAILHGLMNKEASSEKGKLRVEINKQEGMIVCTVEDNGVGRERTKAINSAKKSSHLSSGMSITQNRLEILNALHRSDLSVNITDLKNGGEAAGTRVEIFIPL